MPAACSARRRPWSPETDNSRSDGGRESQPARIPGASESRGFRIADLVVVDPAGAVHDDAVHDRPARCISNCTFGLERFLMARSAQGNENCSRPQRLEPRRHQEEPIPFDQMSQLFAESDVQLAPLRLPSALVDNRHRLPCTAMRVGMADRQSSPETLIASLAGPGTTPQGMERGQFSAIRFTGCQPRSPDVQYQTRRSRRVVPDVRDKTAVTGR
jgi:hypothetical protein